MNYQSNLCFPFSDGNHENELDLVDWGMSSKQSLWNILALLVTRLIVLDRDPYFLSIEHFLNSLLSRETHGGWQVSERSEESCG